MKCRHEHCQELYWLDDAHWHRAKDIALSGNPHGRKCLRCGDYVPLGPANDDSEAVRMECDAARLAQEWADAGHRPGPDRFEWCPTGDMERCERCQLLWLASAIATHGEAGE